MGEFRKENSKWEDADTTSGGEHIYLTQAFAVVDVPWRSLGERYFEVKLKPISIFEIPRQVNLHIIFYF